ncbi:MAG: hypothetical protein RMK19_04780 [Bacteroidia bacterium]|nr:hypothetical protein [Bacteroidia bacterium]MDW8015306.1 hypothetical protein [Bacteroidia bacterium]
MKKCTITFTFFLTLLTLSCHRQKPSEAPSTSPQELPGFELLEALMGIWEGPVTSTTSVGNFSTWKVDFRPISHSQISARNELDSANNIHLSFFIAKYEGQLTLCMRNGGFFAGRERLTYLFLDSSSRGYYRFSEPISKGQRAYAEIRILRPDSLILSAYTNKLRTVSTPVLHMRWNARRLDTSAALEAARVLNFPQKTPSRDLTGAFLGRQEAIFYTPIEGDPYPSNDQPYLSTLEARYRHSSQYNPDPTKFVILFTMTRPILEGNQYKPENLRYITRYVRLPSGKNSFTFQHIHPSRYYLYALYDADGDGMPSRGDWFSLVGRQVEIPPQSSVQAEVEINFQLP